MVKRYQNWTIQDAAKIVMILILRTPKNLSWISHLKDFNLLHVNTANKGQMLNIVQKITVRYKYLEFTSQFQKYNEFGNVT